jgi:hybrid cluster-associated redox disulfide protein
MAKITKDMSFIQVIQKHPRAGEVLAKYDMGCIGCMGAAGETIEQGAISHGVDVNVLLKDLNDLLKKS